MPARTVSARLIGAGFGLLTAAMGVLFVALLWGGYQRARESHTWTPTPCHIVRSEIEPFKPSDHSPPAYRFKVEYLYEVGGTAYTGTHHKPARKNEWVSKHEDTVKELVAKFPAGTDTTCFVDPDDPAIAALRRESKASLYTIWFPGLFVVGGLGFVASCLLTKRPAKSNGTPAE